MILKERIEVLPIISLMVGATCGICALILSLAPANETVSAYAPVVLKVSDPVIIDTVNVFDIYQPADVVQ